MSCQATILQEIQNIQLSVLQSINNMEISYKEINSLLDVIQSNKTAICSQSELHNYYIQKKITKKSAKSPSQKS